MFAIFAKGFISGLIITCGIGPMAILCIRRSLAQGFKAGFATGLGAAVADACYALTAFFGVNMIQGYLIEHATEFRALGGFFFLLFGLKLLFTSPKNSCDITPATLFSDFSSGVLFTFANPATLFTLMALTVSFGLNQYAASAFNLFTLASAVFLGSFIWWVILSLSAQHLRTKINDRLLKLFNRTCAFGLILFGAIAIASLFL